MANDKQRHRTAVILSGAGRYADPWHPFAETSARLAEIIELEGFDVEIAENVDERMTGLSDVDLLVMNVGNPIDLDPALDEPTRVGLLAYLEAGGPLLSKHSSATGFPWIAEWENIEGGRWVDGQSMHPAYGRAHILVHADRSRVLAGMNDFDLDDERYTYLRVNPAVVPLLGHIHDGVEYLLAWTWHYGTAPVVYHALGHDAASYDSAEHCETVARSVRWLMGDVLRPFPSLRVRVG
ncbi:hypothetical protein AX769_20730 (plasmid) [Frondihabitans sp. PAMC 28766]|uniref:ThuA domain-containing protein n=1 Tax=Frondihabitans sp. PAMC 28766 TaxID=1795630 RepID=UPI00078C9A86|nr:ThuA domain-containing protein [Frondihabitans sp. PAMC 28766]AMM22742.1 hypothetical protein AX769_20730 [Frondihabitans sp. PAMC 28766]